MNIFGNKLLTYLLTKNNENSASSNMHYIIWPIFATVMYFEISCDIIY